MSTRQPQNAPPVPIDEHLLTIADVCDRYGTHVDETKPSASVGLASSLASKRLELEGPNVMTPPKRLPAWKKFLFHSLLNLFNILLLVAGSLCFVTFIVSPTHGRFSLIVGSVLISVAFLNATIEFLQERQSAKLLGSFLDLMPRKTHVIRDGQMRSVAAADLVPGDLVVVRMGDKVPADIRLVYTQEFKVDNSSLTGESDPQERNVDVEHQNPLEATNLAFNGSLAVNGEGHGIVVRTGDATMLGQIANMTGSEKKRPSPMSLEIDNYVRIITSVAITTAITFLIVSVIMAHKEDLPSSKIWIPNIAFAIGVFVSFVPEGLPATMTMLLSISAKRLAKRNVLIKELRGVETLGAITCLATDKTGTLTRNQMTVMYVWSGQTFWDASNISQQRASQVSIDQDGHIGMQTIPSHSDMYQPFDIYQDGLNDLTHIAYLCSKAKFDRTDLPLKQRSVIGDATESGLYRFAANALPDSDALNETYPKIFEIPFNSTNKWHLSIHRREHANGHFTLYIKGAPERVFKLCTSILGPNGDVVEMNEKHHDIFQRAYEHLAAKGHRVIGCAKLELNGETYMDGYHFKKDQKEVDKMKQTDPSAKCGIYPKGGYTFVGLVSLEDPPKHGVREAIGQCRQAGIKVMMVTGDHPLTAEAIGRKINLMVQETSEMIAKRTNRPIESIQEHEYNAVVVHGEMIDTFTDDDWDRILDKDEIIFARTSPKHKLQIVKRCQARGHIVGVTGDGVNDSPALKKADLGIAMNISGSDVSKEAAAMILLDDNFASAVVGITEGRLIFQNLKKSIRYTITHTMSQVLANLFYLIIPLPLPLGPLQIIMVDLGFELFNAFTYAYEVPESKKRGLMTMLPRKPVTSRTIAMIKTKAEQQVAKEIFIADKLKAARSDNVSKDDVLNPSTFRDRLQYKIASMQHTFNQMMLPEYWKMKLSNGVGESLVDRDLLSYAYLEMGVLEAIGCLTNYFFVFYYQGGFTPDEVVAYRSNFMNPDEPITNSYGVEYQHEMLSTAQSAYYFSIFIQQCFNLFICKVTTRYPFGRMLFRNWTTFLGIFVGFTISCVVVYAPFMHSAFGTAVLNPLFWVVPILNGCVMLMYGTLRIWWARRRRPANKNMTLPLDLHPTQWSTKSNPE